MLLIAFVLVVVAAACAAITLEAGRVMLPAVDRALPLDSAPSPAVATQRTRETSPDAADDRQRAYTFVASLPAEATSNVSVTL
jgi:hypothetical protein